MNAERRVLWCVGLVLLLTLAGAIGGDASQESIPGERPVLNERSQTLPANSRSATAAASTDVDSNGGSQSPSISSLPFARTAPGGTAESDARGRTVPASEPRGNADESDQPNITSQEHSDSQPSPPKEKSLANRFRDQPYADIFAADQLSWDAADCGCVPALTTFETYGLYPFWDKKDVGPVNFGIWSRIGYYALTPDDSGHVQAPAGWMGRHVNKHAALVPHRYGTKVDLVIRNNRWPDIPLGEGKGLALDTPYVMLELVDNVVGLVSEFGFDGVTIDFDLSSFALQRPDGSQHRPTKEDRVKRRYVQSYLLFMKQLGKALKQMDKEIRLHAVLQYDTDTSNKKLPRPFTKGELKELIDSVDLLLFIPDLDDTKHVQAMKQYDDYFADFEYGEVTATEKKLVFVMDTEAEALVKELADIRTDRFGGVGGWMLHKGIEDEMTRKWIDPAFAQNRGYVERLDQDVLPSPFCKLVCPNRSILVAVIVALMSMYIGAFLLSFFSPLVETVVRTNEREVMAGALVIVLLIGALFFCVPQWSAGWATELTLLFLLSVGGYALNLMRVKKRETNYP